MKVLLIGAGTIAMGPSEPNYFRSLQNHSKFHLAGIVESNPNRLSEIAHLKMGFFSLEEAYESKKYDLVIICTPDETHGQILKEVLGFNPKAVIVEKPVTINPDETLEILEKYKDKGVLLIPNYTRRFLPHYESLKKKILEEGPVSTIVYYAKGLKHNGCHALDWIEMMYGPIHRYHVLNAVHDYKESDPTLSLSLSTKIASNIVMQGLNESYYTHFEMDIFTQLGRYRIYEDHRRLDVYQLISNTGHPPGKRLVNHASISLAHEKAIHHLLDYTYQYLKKGLSSSPLMAQAARIEKLSEDIMCQYQGTLEDALS